MRGNCNHSGEVRSASVREGELKDDISEMSNRIQLMAANLVVRGDSRVFSLGG